MNWEAFSAIGEIVSAFAVIVTIGYLAIQMRQNTSAIRLTASQGVQAELRSMYGIVMTDPITEIYLRGMDDPDQLTTVEKAKLDAFLAHFLAATENVYDLVQEGVFDDKRAMGWWKILSGLLKYPAAKQHWEKRGFRFSEDFQSFVENEVMNLDVPNNITAILGGRE